MKCVDAAYKVLCDDDGPLHYKEMTRRMVKDGLWRTRGRTSEATVDARITDEMQAAGAISRFVRVGIGVYAAATPETQLLSKISKEKCGLSVTGPWTDTSRGLKTREVVKVSAGLACVLSGWRFLNDDERAQVLKIISNAHAAKTSRPAS
jgi:hypothetical protein